MKYSFVFTLTVQTCILGFGLVQSFNLDLSQVVDQIRKTGKSAVGKDAKPYSHDTADRLLPNVRQFQQDHDIPSRISSQEQQRNSPSSLFSSILLHGAPIQGFAKPSKYSSKLSAPFKWESCGNPPQIMEIISLSVKPDPVSFPGSVTFSFDIKFHDSITKSENVTVALDVYRKVGEEWLRIPCVGVVGSCTYVDFCQVINGNTCPEQFIKEGVPCKCPFNKGEYTMNDFTIEIDAEVFVGGDYKAKAQVSSDQKGKIACYEIFLSAD